MSLAWLETGRTAAVCLSIDDVHPGRSGDHYEAGGDLRAGVLGRLQQLIDRHPQLRATLFVTPDWREGAPFVTRRRLARVPWVNRHLHLSKPLPRGSMRITRHPEFVAYLRSQPNWELAVHGLSHSARGPRPFAEFDALGVGQTRRRLRRARRLFEAARLPFVDGFSAPGWGPTVALQTSLPREGFRWICAARDIDTPIEAGAVTAGSGLRGVSLLTPQRLAPSRLLHFPVNFQHTSSDRRALEILSGGGLLSIKAHAIKDAFGYIALDGLDDRYCERLDRLLDRIEDEFGDGVWWTTMGEIEARLRDVANAPDRAAA